MDGQLTAMRGSALYPLCCLHRFADVHPRRWRRSWAVRGSLLYPVTWQVPNRSTFGPRCQWRSQHCQGPALSRGSRVKLPPDSGATARKSRSSNVSSRLVRNRWARTTTERSASPRSRASYCSPSLATVPCSSAVSPSTRNRLAATSRRNARAASALPRLRMRWSTSADTGAGTTKSPPSARSTSPTAPWSRSRESPRATSGAASTIRVTRRTRPADPPPAHPRPKSNPRPCPFKREGSRGGACLLIR